jgi:hypothetical protein
MRTTVDISEPVLRNAKRIAALRGVTLSAAIEDSLRIGMARGQDKACKPVRLHTVRGELVQPDLDLDRASALVALDDESAFAPR